MVNKELFLQIADRIEKEPWTHSQLNWNWDEEQGGCIFCHAEKILGIRHEYRSVALPPVKTTEALGLSMQDAKLLYSMSWKPHEGLTVPEALRMIANGASVSEVSEKPREEVK